MFAKDATNIKSEHTGTTTSSIGSSFRRPLYWDLRPVRYKSTQLYFWYECFTVGKRLHPQRRVVLHVSWRRSTPGLDSNILRQVQHLYACSSPTHLWKIIRNCPTSLGSGLWDDRSHGLRYCLTLFDRFKSISGRRYLWVIEWLVLFFADSDTPEGVNGEGNNIWPPILLRPSFLLVYPSSLLTFIVVVLHSLQLFTSLEHLCLMLRGTF